MIHDAARISRCLTTLAGIVALGAACHCGGSDSPSSAQPANVEEAGSDSTGGSGGLDAAPDTSSGAETSAGGSSGSAGSGGTGGGSFGFVSPRCGSALVQDCGECPGMPYACDGCELSSHCVADCSAECGGTTACSTSGTCYDPNFGDCGSEPFCGCSGDTKACEANGVTACIADCNQCTGSPYNGTGKCSAVADLSCPDGAGPEYQCGLGSPIKIACGASCEACGPTYCLARSCYSNSSGGTSCENGYVPGLSFYICLSEGCCTSGFYCPSTQTCVASCGECGADYQVACGTNGVCVKSCSECECNPNETCEGVCTNTDTSSDNCGGCGNECKSAGSEYATCAEGHCCKYLPSNPVDSTAPWCEPCNCCWSAGWPPCDKSVCKEGCLPEIP